MSELFCPKCGKGNPDGALICQYCDTPLVTFPPRDPVDQSPLTPEPILPGEQPEPVEPEQAQSSIPDWLIAIREKKEQAKPQEPVLDASGRTEQEKADLDSWLAQLRGGTMDVAPQKPEEPQAESPSVEEGETTPTWLSSIRSKITVENPLPDEPESSDSGGDWLSNLRKQTEELSLPEEQGESAPVLPSDENGEIPIGEKQELPAEESVLLPEDAAIQPEQPGMDQDDGETIKWQDIFSDHKEETPVEGTNLPVGAEYANGGSLPSPAEIYDEGEQPRERMTTKDLPDWLSSFMGVDESGKPPESALLAGLEEKEPAENGIEPGAIPGWVKAMRPVDTTPSVISTPVNTDRRFEENGPLAGIRGILPGQDLEITYVKPSARSSRETSLTNIAHFENTLQVETEEQKTPVYKRSKTSNVVRWMIAAILLLVVIMVQAGGGAPDLLPRNIPVETMSFFRSISSISQGSNILLVLDYEPAYSGEIETAASSPISLMMLKQSNLYTLSTSSANLFLADKLLKSVSSVHPAGTEAYLSKDKYKVLGYLPGGQSGMQGLLRDFSGSLPVGLDLKRTAEMSGLTGVRSLNDFTAIMILTDNPDTARTWVEQIKPQLTKPAIWMAVTSQAVVLVRPYVRSGQIDGLISGVYGAASFEQIIQQPGAAAQIWNGYYTTLLLAMVMIIAGGFVNFIGFSILRARMKRERSA